MGHNPVSILIVDDDEVSVLSMKRTIRNLSLDNPVRVAGDGLDALEILRRPEGPDHLPHPYIVLLDLNMPRMTGHEFLQEVRLDPGLKSTVVFVLSTSSSPDDIQRAYGSQAAGYFVKDGSAQNLRAAFDVLGAYSEVAVLPDPTSQAPRRGGADLRPG